MGLASEVKRIGVLGIALAVLGILGSSASVASGFGVIGIATSIALTLIVFIICISILRPLLVKNARGVTMLEAIMATGVADVESRQDDRRPLPSIEFYRLARAEIVISSISGALTFHLQARAIRELLDAGIKVHILMLHPSSPELDEVVLHGVRRKQDIDRALSVMKAEKLDEHPGFRVRFRQRIPPFAAVMIDGDISPTGREPHDRWGQIRIQPTTLYVPLQRGVVIQLRRLDDSRRRPFDYFAEDLRNQWRFEGRECPALFT